MRGERRRAGAHLTVTIGSSPHARGTLPDRQFAGLLIRFIPACAGNAANQKLCAVCRSVHPRMRGERIRCSTLIMSPPWFIPACAGNAPLSASGARLTAVHPRMRGERFFRIQTAVAGRGSSPHARGTHGCWWGSDREVRFIPACAGNARRGVFHLPPGPVHPRMRGERPRCPVKRRPDDGSSPHARGTRVKCQVACQACRFIPACAGNAFSGRREFLSPTVHPRMRGERRIEYARAPVAYGSSPHARGTPARPARPRSRCRFIPACAGNALPVSY